jgi:methyl-accepting chemotaxis protein
LPPAGPSEKKEGVLNKGIVDRGTLYALGGFLLGVSAPVGWALLRLLFFASGEKGLWSQLLDDVFRSAESLALYAYMGGGTAMVLGTFGFLIGRASQQIHERAQRLDELNAVIASQKETFERRFEDLNYGIKKFHQINTHIQKSVERGEVLRLVADGLHEGLDYDRVNIFLLDAARTTLGLYASRGSDALPASQRENVSLPFDERAGAIWKVASENRALLIDDIGHFPAEYRLQPPYDRMEILRCRSFILCPIRIKDEVVGVFTVDNKHRGTPLNDTDADTVQLFSNQVSSSLTKIDLLDGVDILTRQLEHTFDELLSYREDHSRADFSLKHASASTSEATGHIVEAADVVRDSVDATRSAATEISVSIEQVSQNINRLKEFVESSISAMTEISMTIKAVQENAVQSHLMSETVKVQAELGTKEVAGTVESLKGIGVAVAKAGSAIERLSKKGIEISGITGVIAEITQKTNLLALNASIIAAQAGEHGRSFAVVAQEVRTLSEETAQSTGAIGQVIEEIQQYTRETVAHIGETRKLVGEGISRGESLEVSLHQILDSADSAKAMAQDMRRATQEVACSVESISCSIEDLGEMSGQIFQASREQSQGIRSIVRSIEEVKQVSDGMVTATEQQRRNTRDIESAVSQVSDMAQRIFEELESRRQESRKVIEGLENLKIGAKDNA